MNEYSRHLFQIFRDFTVIGDSLSCGYTEKDGIKFRSIPSKDQESNWPSYIARRNGTVLKHLGIGGTTAKSWRETFMELAHVETDCYIIGLGVNDKRTNLPIGTAADICEEYTDNADSFYGNYDFVLRRLLTWNPQCHIFLLTIPKIEEERVPDEGIVEGITAEYNAAIRYLAEKYASNVHLIDLYKKAEYTSGIIEACSTCGHFTPLAYNYMSTIIEDEICDFMDSHAELFILAPYK